MNDAIKGRTSVREARVRDDAIDWLRGLVMTLMVLDHARDFWGGFRVKPLDLATTTPVLFATRCVTHFRISYPLVPWIGVMALGYAFGRTVALPAECRRAQCLTLGITMTVGFIVLRALNRYGDPVPWAPQRSLVLTVLSFLNCEKYPPSLDYLLMTLGPALTLFAFAPALSARVRVLTVFGKTALLFYVLHLFLLRYTSLPVALARFGASALAPFPKGTGASPELPLAVTYGAWLATLIALYPVCRWYARVKATRKYAWTSYL